MAAPSSPSPSAPHAPQGSRRTERGIPDGAIVGLLAFLLGTTALVWASTGLGALAAHGHFPHPLPFLATAGAIRHLATAPNDIPGAWPTTPTSELPTPTAFWLTFFALLAACLLLLLSAATARAKRRATHRQVRQGWGPAGGQGGSGGSERSGSDLDSAPAHSGPAAQRTTTPAPPQQPAPTPGNARWTPPGPRRPAPAAGGPSRRIVTPTGDHAGSDTAYGAEGADSRDDRTARDGWAARDGWGATDGWAGEDDLASEHPGVPAGRLRPGAPAPSEGTDGWGPGRGDAPTVAGLLPFGDTVADAELGADPRTSLTDPNPRPFTGRQPLSSSEGRHSARLPGSRAEAAPSWESGGETGGARGRHGAELRFALPDIGTMCVFAPEAGSVARRALVSGVIAEAKHAPLVVVTADPAVWDGRPPYRRAALFDPQHLGAEDPDVPRGRWAPHTGCAEPVVATARARALLLATERPVADAQEQSVRALAETLLRCWLRAAALDGRPFRHVARWAGSGSGTGSAAGTGTVSAAGFGTGRQEAVAILQSAASAADAASGEESWAGQLQAALLRSDDTVTGMLDAALGRIRAALAAVAELHVLAACTPESPASALDPGALLRDGSGSLYILGRSGHGRLREPGSGVGPAAHSAMPLLSALVDDVVRRAWDAAPEQRYEGLDPAPLLVLDDIAAVAPFPALPQLMADGATHGLRALTLFRSPEQARARWGERAVHSLWTTADHRAVLGPLPQAALAALLASVGATEHGSRQPALGPEELLVLPGHGKDGLPQRFRIEATQG